MENCKANGTIPKFLNIKTYNQRVKTTNAYRSFQCKLLNLELKEKRKALKQLDANFSKLKNDFKNKFSWIDYNCIYNRLITSNTKKLATAKWKQEKKLKSLGIPVGYQIDKDKVVINLSKRTLTDPEKEVLSLGLGFALPRFKIDYVQHFFGFEKIVSIIKTIKHNLNGIDNVANHLSTIAYSAYTQFKDAKLAFPKLPIQQFEALMSLKTDKTIHVTRPDKGTGTVILDKSDYINKVEAILCDQTKFKEIKEDILTFITRLEDKLARKLRDLLKAAVITKDEFSFLFTSGSSPGVLYGLPKIHKKNTPIRPILSTINTFNYNLAKYFVKLITPLTVNEYTINNSFDFVKELKGIDLNKYTMASFDVESLFTNIPLDETIGIITEELFKDSSLYYGYTKKQFGDLLALAVKETPFYFNNKLFVQTDGVGMGSCLGPSFANSFLGFHECNWLNNCPPSFKPAYYRRYVDDTFLLFKDPKHIPAFLDYLNKQHSNIKFTSEIEENNCLPFLDVLVKKGSHVTTTVYRKPTFTGLGTRYTSFIPQLFKINAIITMFTRCYNIASNWIAFDEEISFLTRYFMNNGFPRHLVNNVIFKCLNKRLAPVNGDIESDPDKTYYLKLPYYGHLSFTIRNKLTKLLKENYPDYVFRLIFTNTLTIGSFFKHKDSLPFHLTPNVIYGYTCSSCKARYIGETKRNIALRFAEHKGVSSRTNKQLSNPSFSAIRQHSQLKKTFVCY